MWGRWSAVRPRMDWRKIESHNFASSRNLGSPAVAAISVKSNFRLIRLTARGLTQTQGIYNLHMLFLKIVEKTPLIYSSTSEDKQIEFLSRKSRKETPPD